jgi:hypothetical protein
MKVAGFSEKLVASSRLHGVIYEKPGIQFLYMVYIQRRNFKVIYPFTTSYLYSMHFLLFPLSFLSLSSKYFLHTNFNFAGVRSICVMQVTFSAPRY